MNLKTTLSLLLLALTFLKCTADEEKKVVVEKIETLNLENDSIQDAFIIKLERGAFHYDTFMLTDSILTYTPENNLKPEKGNVYSNPIELTISNQQKEELIAFIINHDFWSLKEEYKAKSSCTSGISISISLGTKKKNIISDDYIRNCPKALFLLEQKLIELTGKDLKRVNLPG